MISTGVTGYASSITSRSGSGYGSGSSGTVLTMLKRAVLAPIPTARVSTVAASAAGSGTCV